MAELKKKELKKNHYKSFDAKHLAKWMTKNNSDLDVKIETIGETSYIKINGNPNKVKLPDQWEYDREHGFKNKNKADPEFIAIIKQPLKAIDDTLDLIYQLEILNPEVKFYYSEDGKGLEVVGKTLDACVLPSTFKFDGDFLTNEGNVNEGSRPLAITVKSMEAHGAGSVTQADVQNSMSADKYEMGKGFLDTFSSLANKLTETYSSVVNSRIQNSETFDTAQFDLTTLKNYYKTYVPYVDPTTQKVFVQDRVTGAIVQDETLGNATIFIHNMISQFHNTTRTDSLDNQTFQTNTSYGEIDWEQLEDYYNKINGSNEAQKEVIMQNNQEITNQEEISKEEIVQKTEVTAGQDNSQEFNEFIQLYQKYKPGVQSTNVQSYDMNASTQGEKFIELREEIAVNSAEKPVIYDIEMVNKTFYIYALVKEAREKSDGSYNSVYQLYSQTKSNPDQIRAMVQKYQEYLRNPNMDMESENVMELTKKPNNG